MKAPSLLSLLAFASPPPPATPPAVKKDVLLIGTGVAGLCTAARLQKSGRFQVTVVEKNSRDAVGGRLNEQRLGPYRFETGPSLLLLPGVYRETFRELGVDLDSHVTLRKVEPSYGVYFRDGSRVDLHTEREKMRAALEQVEPGSFDKYTRYLDIAQANLDFGLSNLIEERLDPLPLPRFAAAMLEAWPLQGHHRLLSSLFSTEKMRALLSFQDLYVGLTPYQAPAVFSLLQAIELNEGVYYPMGGFHQIAQLLLKTAEGLGVRFLFDTEVEEITTIHDEAGGGVPVATGVRIKGGPSGADRLGADVVVSNVDAPFTNKYLLAPELRVPQDHDGRLSFSSSVVSFCFALDRRLSSLRHHSVFLDDINPHKSWDSVFEQNRFDPSCCNFYVHSPARTDPSVCPDGHDAVMVLVPCPILGPDDQSMSQEEEQRLVSQAREAVISRIEQVEGAGSVRRHIVEESVITPSEWRRRYGLSRGAVFGLRHSLNQLSLFRPPFARPDLCRRLYYCGASNRPGNGVPLTMIGARLLTRKILREEA